MSDLPGTPLTRRNTTTTTKPKPTPKAAGKGAQGQLAQEKEIDAMYAAQPAGIGVKTPAKAAARGQLRPTANDTAVDLQAVLKRMEQIESELDRECEQNKKLQHNVTVLTEKTCHGNDAHMEEEEDTEDISTQPQKELMAEQEALSTEQETVAWLQEQLEQLDANGQEVTSDLVPRLKGTAGADWSIQEVMGLAGSEKKHGIYRALVRKIHDLTLNARIKWDSKWADIPASDKAKLFQVARDQHPYLKWWLNIPENYAYLKKKQANVVLSAKKKAKQKAAHSRKGKSKVTQADDEASDEDHQMDEGEDEDEN
ncbi:uncharacterized protein LACBIDRAFT_333580 [Laccaria bicolor S238N-H82]|uniref:Predicted protein n=1 Tax=Laccaria bicolor (strain S238N-H82 / ATCC MYA-4686) TaxID=486041 RepID=B0DWD9_LACBS|nr:uncharacterized protein LACBIDRAFT_333580 [Laccaria bicolor S238N-H82]EDR01071.1 predicted protein [Laccaria bicolor S238N-H82]|eukprot:XP_001888290.1 predicted protein [Laccaria bicolor S238N-H82]